MSNKSKGSGFERFFGNLLAYNGFWAHILQDNRNGQPFDVIAVKGNVPYAFDCKECEGSSFSLSRIEPNQISAMNRWIQTGNGNAYFAIKFSRSLNIYIVPFGELDSRRLKGVTSMTEAEIRRVSAVCF